MISHEFRCIYIHIPRTAGSSIEQAICGSDWWQIEPDTKHLIASQARRAYAQYWDDYFKFSIVRNPLDRMLSALKYGEYFASGFDPAGSFADFLRGYKRRFGFPVTVEFDHRFGTKVESNRSLENAVYLNMLDEDLDFVGKFEDLEPTFETISRAIGLERGVLTQQETSVVRQPKSLVDAEARALIRSLFSRDIEYFGYPEIPEAA